MKMSYQTKLASVRRQVSPLRSTAHLLALFNLFINFVLDATFLRLEKLPLERTISERSREKFPQSQDVLPVVTGDNHL